MKLFNDIGDFLETLSFIDVVFFFAVLIVIILVITLIYFIKINKDDEEEKKQDDETAEMKIVKEIRENMKNDDVVINFTDYEKDQEEKAIISYDELLNKSNKYGLNYEKEDVYDDLSVKKVNLDNIANKNSEIKVNSDVRVISFAKEEAFLEALKRLQKELG